MTRSTSPGFAPPDPLIESGVVRQGWELTELRGEPGLLGGGSTPAPDGEFSEEPNDDANTAGGHFDGTPDSSGLIAAPERPEAQSPNSGVIKDVLAKIPLNVPDRALAVVSLLEELQEPAARIITAAGRAAFHDVRGTLFKTDRAGNLRLSKARLVLLAFGVLTEPEAVLPGVAMGAARAAAVAATKESAKIVVPPVAKAAGRRLRVRLPV